MWNFYETPLPKRVSLRTLLITTELLYVFPTEGRTEVMSQTFRDVEFQHTSKFSSANIPVTEEKNYPVTGDF